MGIAKSVLGWCVWPGPVWSFLFPHTAVAVTVRQGERGQRGRLRDAVNHTPESDFQNTFVILPCSLWAREEMWLLALTWVKRATANQDDLTADVMDKSGGNLYVFPPATEYKGSIQQTLWKKKVPCRSMYQQLYRENVATGLTQKILLK